MRSKGIDPRENIQSKKKKAKQDKENSLQNFIDTRYRSFIEAHHKNAYGSLRRIQYFVSEWGRVPLEKITAKHLEDYRQKRLKEGRSNATINREMNILQGLFSKAIDWDIVKESPFRKIKPLKVDKKGKERYLSVDEEKALRRALRARDKQIRDTRLSSDKWHLERGYKLHTTRLDNYTYVDYSEPTVLIALHTGMRKGELLSLRWQDINLKEGIISLRGENTKSSQSRNIPMSGKAKEILTRLHDEWFESPERHVFTHSLTGEQLKDIKTAWKTLLDNAGIQDFRFHDLRHTFASNLAMAEVDLNTIKELLGHSSTDMVQRYAHLSPNHLKKAISVLDNR